MNNLQQAVIKAKKELFKKHKMMMFEVPPYNMFFAVANTAEDLKGFFDECEIFEDQTVESINFPLGVTYALYQENKYLINLCVYIKDEAVYGDIEGTIWHESLHVAMNILNHLEINYSEQQETITYLQGNIANNVKLAYKKLRGANYGYHN